MAAGLLAGRKATTHRSAMDELRGTAQVVDQRIVEDGLVTTAGGVTASLDLGLHLLLKHFGSELADEVADTLEYRRQKNPSEAGSSSADGAGRFGSLGMGGILRFIGYIRERYNNMY